MVKQSAFKDLVTHFPEEVTEAVVQFATDTVFLKSRYVFVWREGPVQMAYCTHCKTEYPIGRGAFYAKHNEKTQCLHCQSPVIAKNAGRGRSKLFDDAYFVWYEKSRLDEHVVIAYGIYTFRDYRGDFREVETRFETQAMYLFDAATKTRKGNVRMIKRDWCDGWKECKSAYSLVETEMKYKYVYCSHDSIDRAVKGTVLQYTTWREYTRQSFDLIRFFALASNYPCVEYLTKLGFRRLVEAKLAGYRTYRTVNWRGRSLDKVLGLPKEELRKARTLPFPIEPLTLLSYHHYHKEGFPVSLEEAHFFRDFVAGYGYSVWIDDAITQYHTSLEELLHYFLKQSRRADAPRTYDTAQHILSDWRDYLKQCTELGIDITKGHVKFPNSLHAAHQKTTRKAKLKHDATLNQLIAERRENLSSLIYSDGTYLIRPAATLEELFEEGKRLHHCVGGYADQYAKGRCDIFLVRRLSQPDKPFCTVEIVANRIEQARTKNNGDPSNRVHAFLKKFSVAKLQPKSKKQAQGVAV